MFLFTFYCFSFLYTAATVSPLDTRVVQDQFLKTDSDVYMFFVDYSCHHLMKFSTLCNMVEQSYIVSAMVTCSSTFWSLKSMSIIYNRHSYDTAAIIHRLLWKGKLQWHIRSILKAICSATIDKIVSWLFHQPGFIYVVLFMFSIISLTTFS